MASRSAENLVSDDDAPGVYVHIPFCVAKCAYCHFAIDPSRPDESRRERYLRALLRELDRARNGLELSDSKKERIVNPHQADTLYIGGGTPSLLPPERIKWLIEVVRSRIGLAENAEVTLEANPGDLDHSGYRALHEAGVDRLSLGVQSLDVAVLRQMGRDHTPKDACDAIEQARAAGFANISVDLILGWLGETRARWTRTLNAIEKMAPDHVSLYLLETEGRNKLTHHVRQGSWILPSEDLVADLYEETTCFLENRGWSRYEISNYARAGRESRHNLKYWEDAPYWGFGMSAHSYTSDRRFQNISTFGAYCRALESGLSHRAEERALSLRERVGAALMTGLRMTRGVPLSRLRARYGVEPMDLFAGDLRDVVEAGLLVVEQERLRLTPRGALIANEVFQAFV